MTLEHNHSSSPYDFNLHDMVRIRLVDPSPRDAAAVKKQLGFAPGSFQQPPDITIRFVDRLAFSSTMTYLTPDEAGFTADAFLVLRSKHKATARVQIDFQQVGQACEILCETGLPAVPLLIPIINLTALAKGFLPLHASGFVYEGKGILSTGWSKGGKTEMLLAFMANGAQYIGDEWVYISPDGKRMHGIPEPIRVWDWHLQDLPVFRERIKQGDRNRLKALKAAQSVGQALSGAPGIKNVLGKTVHRAMPLLKQQMHVDVRPQELFGQSVDNLTGPIDRVFFVTNHADPSIRVHPVDSEEIAGRMNFSLSFERMNFLSYYLAYRFAFPHSRNPIIEQAEDRQRELLRGVLQGKACYQLAHPYPVKVSSLYETACPYL